MPSSELAYGQPHGQFPIRPKAASSSLSGALQSVEVMSTAQQARLRRSISNFPRNNLLKSCNVARESKFLAGLLLQLCDFLQSIVLRY